MKNKKDDEVSRIKSGPLAGHVDVLYDLGEDNTAFYHRTLGSHLKTTANKENIVRFSL